MKDLSVKKTIKLKADAAKVWDALTSPEFTKKYFFGCEVNSDWREGSSIMFNDIRLQRTLVKGQIEKFEPRKLLQYTVHNGGNRRPLSFTRVTDEISQQDGYTTLNITQDNFGAGHHALRLYKECEAGWDIVLNGLKKLLEPNG